MVAMGKDFCLCPHTRIVKLLFAVLGGIGGGGGRGWICRMLYCLLNTQAESTQDVFFWQHHRKLLCLNYYETRRYKKFPTN